MQKSYEAVKYFTTEQVNIAPGATVAQFIDSYAGQNSVLAKWISGGSMCIIGLTGYAGTPGPTFLGATLSAGALASLFSGNAFYLSGTQEAVSYNGPVKFYVAAINATLTISLQRGFSE